MNLHAESERLLALADAATAENDWRWVQEAPDVAAHIRALDARVRELEAAMPEYRNARMNVSPLRDAGPTELRGRVTRREE